MREAAEEILFVSGRLRVQPEPHGLVSLSEPFALESMDSLTAMRYPEIRLLKWKQVDFSGKQVWVGKSKAECGEGRPIPMNDRAFPGDGHVG